MKKIAIFSSQESNDLDKKIYANYLFSLLKDKYEVEMFGENNLNRDSKSDEFKKYDLNIYNLSNSKADRFICDFALDNPGLVILHDYFLDNNKQFNNENSSGNLLNYEFINKNFAIITHSSYVAQILSQQFGEKIFYLPYPYFTHKVNRENEEKEINLSVFNINNKGARIGVILSVFNELIKDVNDNLKLNLITTEEYDLKKIENFINEQKLQDHIFIHYVKKEEEYNKFLINSDINIWIEYPSNNRMPYTLIQALGAGIGSVVSNNEHLNEFPDDTLIKIPIDKDEKKRLYAYLHLLITDNSFRQLLSDRSRKYIKKHHSASVLNKDYYYIIEKVMKRFQDHKKVIYNDITSTINELLD